jgi:hypothetical protein
MGDPLLDVKRGIRDQYVGRCGIHGVGVSRSQKAVRVYIDPDATIDQELAAELGRKAEPFKLVFVREEPPVKTARPT